MKLHDRAEITTGFTFRSGLKPEPEGNVRVIQTKDLIDDQLNASDSLTKINGFDFKSNHTVKQGDILFRARGHSHTAALIPHDTPNTIVAAPLLHVRVKSEKVVPEYLLWWINQHTSQQYFSRLSEGTNVKKVNTAGLKELEVLLPPIQEQKKIAALMKLDKKEQQILTKLADLKANFMERILMRVASESRH